MVVPFTLPYGTVAVYGIGVTRGMAQFTPNPNNNSFLFGTIYQIGNAYDVDFQVGDSVMFNKLDVQCRLVTEDNINFTVVEQAKLVLKEVIP